VSNAESNAQLDARLAKEPERDGVTIDFDHEAVMKLHAILGNCEVGEFPGIYEELDDYIEENGDSPWYEFDLVATHRAAAIVLRKGG